MGSGASPRGSQTSSGPTLGQNTVLEAELRGGTPWPSQLVGEGPLCKHSPVCRVFGCWGPLGSPGAAGGTFPGSWFPWTPLHEEAPGPLFVFHL